MAQKTNSWLHIGAIIVLSISVTVIVILILIMHVSPYFGTIHFLALDSSISNTDIPRSKHHSLISDIYISRPGDPHLTPTTHISTKNFTSYTLHQAIPINIDKIEELVLPPLPCPLWDNLTYSKPKIPSKLQRIRNAREKYRQHHNLSHITNTSQVLRRKSFRHKYRRQDKYDSDDNTMAVDQYNMEYKREAIKSRIKQIRMRMDDQQPPKSRSLMDRERPHRLPRTKNKFLHKRRNPNETVFVRDSCWTNVNDDKLIIFIHFHKAGGSSIIDSARSVARLFTIESNGNPRYERKEDCRRCNRDLRIPFWTYSGRELLNFFYDMKKQNVSFIVMENEFWSYPESVYEIKELPKIKANGPKIEMIIQFRNPFERFVSNFFWEISQRNYREMKVVKYSDIRTRLMFFHEHADDMMRHVNFRGVASWNMYIRVLTGQFDKEYIDENDLEIAKERLDKFDAVTVLEVVETHKLMAYKYGIQLTLHSKNHLQRNLDLLNDGGDEMKILMEFQKEFEELNVFDYKLYKYAIQLSQKMLGEL